MIKSFKLKFGIGKEYSGSFKYLGLNIQQQEKNIKINQIKYCPSLELLNISKERKFLKNLPLDNEELNPKRPNPGQKKN